MHWRYHQQQDASTFFPIYDTAICELAAVPTPRGWRSQHRSGMGPPQFLANLRKSPQECVLQASFQQLRACCLGPWGEAGRGYRLTSDFFRGLPGLLWLALDAMLSFELWLCPSAPFAAPLPASIPGTVSWLHLRVQPQPEALGLLLGPAARFPIAGHVQGAVQGWYAEREAVWCVGV